MKNNQPPASTALPTDLHVPGAAPVLEVNITTALAVMTYLKSVTQRSC